jgi:hypothetical protein
MKLTRYIIWTTNIDDTNFLMKLIEPQCSVVVSISKSILCVETEITPIKVREMVGDEFEMACLEMDEQFINRLLAKKFLEDEKKNFFKFLEMTKTPSTIDEALDLINERGGVEFLTRRERQALDKMTNKSN